MLEPACVPQPRYPNACAEHHGLNPDLVALIAFVAILLLVAAILFFAQDMSERRARRRHRRESLE